MKRLLGASIALPIIVFGFRISSPALSPLLPENLPIEASIIPGSFTVKNSPAAVTLQLLETVIEHDRNFERAEKILEQTPKTKDNEHILELYQAKIFSRTLQFEKALQLLSLIPEQDTVLLKAAVLIAMGDHDSAKKYISGLTDNSDPHISDTATELLELFKNFEFHRDADESYLWTLFAQKLGELGESELSQYLAQKAVNKRPEYRDAWIIKGYDEFQLKSYDRAELSLLKAYQLDPGNPTVQYLLGILYADLKKTELSNRYLLYARQNSPEKADVILETLGENAISEKEYALSEHYFEELRKLQPNHKRALSRLIWLSAEQLSHNEKALEYAQQLVKIAPDDSTSYGLLSWVLNKMGRTQEAAEVSQKSP